MAAAERRRGRRDNGLDAADWRAISDLDPRTSEDVLDTLAAHGIAAYVQPAMDVDPITRSATVPARPADRLYVDRGQVDAARDCVRELLADPPAGAAGAAQAPEPDQPSARPSEPEPPDPPSGGSATADYDATFAGIVAGFDRQVDPTATPWPDAENVAGYGSSADRTTAAEPGAEQSTEAPPETRRPTGPVDARRVTEGSLLDGLDTFGADLPDEPTDERFVPPTPPPLPRLSRQAVLAGLAIVAGLLLLVGRPDVLPLERATSMLLGFAAILGGAVALIMRLRPEPDPEDTSPDDGAQV